MATSVIDLTPVHNRSASNKIRSYFSAALSKFRTPRSRRQSQADVRPIPDNVLVFGRSLCAGCQTATPADYLSDCGVCGMKFCPKCDPKCRCEVMPDVGPLLAAAEYTLRINKLIDGRLAEVINDPKTVVNIKDEAGRLLYVNSTLENIACMTHQEMKGKTMDQLMPDEFAARLTDGDNLVLRTNKPREIVARMERGGREIVWLVKKAAMKCEKAYFIVTTWTDITNHLDKVTA